MIGGIGIVFVGLVIVPIFMMLLPQPIRQVRIRYIIHLGFGLIVSILRLSRNINLSIYGAEFGSFPHSRILIANHPSWVDVIVLVSFYPNACCIVKQQIWENPVLGFILRQAGYIGYTRSENVVDLVCTVLTDKDQPTVVIFPEGTRTPPDGRYRIKNGASAVAIRSRLPIQLVHIYMNPRCWGKYQSWFKIDTIVSEYVVTFHRTFDASSYIIADKSLRANVRAGSNFIRELLIEYDRVKIPQ